MKDEVIKMRCCDKKCCKKNKISKFFGFGDLFLDAFDEDYNDEYCDLSKEDIVRENVKDKLLTDESLTVEEYLTLLEIAKSKFKSSFELKNGKYELIFREIPLENKVNTIIRNNNVESEEKNNEER